MRTLILIFVILSMIYLNSSCVSRPDVLILPQRFIHLETIVIDGKKYIDIETSFCAERNYKYSIDFIGPTEKYRNVDLFKCDRLTGYGPKPYVDNYNFLEDVRQEIRVSSE